jgi:hypothetical protein
MFVVIIGISTEIAASSKTSLTVDLADTIKAEFIDFTGIIASAAMRKVSLSIDADSSTIG